MYIPLIFMTGCIDGRKSNQNSTMKTIDNTNLYAWNKKFLQKYTKIIELSLGNSAILLAPDWQGRVMTSTSEGENGFSFGWINHNIISSGQLLPHINAFGGEERLWLGPEGGQFSIFFQGGKEFTYENWQTPPLIDTWPFEVTERTEKSVLFSKSATLTNYSGYTFEIKIDRRVTLIPDREIDELSNADLKGLNVVAYRSENTLINTGREEWKKETGLLSIWMLGMLNPSPAVVIVIPVKEGNENELGPKMNDNYFGSIPSDRLKLIDNHIFFKADGKSRGKIGIPPLRVTGVMGSFDSENNILTLLFCSLPEGITEYVNSAWELQEKPYSGDAFNAYNDGPLADGSQMGPFYELETSSPAAMLKPGQSLTHTQITVHITGNRDKMDRIAVKTLGVPLETIEKAFK